MARRQTLTCSFCGKPREAVQRLIAGPDVFICDACVRLCNEIISADPGQDAPASGVRPVVPWTQHGGWWRRFLPGQGRVLMGTLPE